MDKEQLEQIITTYADMIYRIALHHVKNTTEAEDIFQEVCVALLTKNPPQEEPHLKYWIIRTTINKCNSFHRLLWQKRENIEDFNYLTSPQQQKIMEEIYSLPKNYRNVIYLYYYENYTIAEIAEILKKNINTVNSHLQRARKKLKDILTEEGEM